MLREVPNSEDSDPEFEESTATFLPSVEVHEDSDPDFDTSDDIFADVQREKTPSQSAAVIIEEAEKAFPGLLDSISIFGGDSPEDNLRLGMKYVMRMESAIGDLTFDALRRDGSSRNPLEYVMSQRRYTLAGSVANSPVAVPRQLKDAYISALKQRLSNTELIRGGSRLFGGSRMADYDRDIRLISSLSVLSNLDAVRNNPTDPAKAAEERLTSLTYIGRGQGSGVIGSSFNYIDIPVEMARTGDNLEELNNTFIRLEDFFVDKVRISNPESNPDWSNNSTRIRIVRSGDEASELFYRLHPNADKEKYTAERTKTLLGFNSDTTADPDLAALSDRILVINLDGLDAKGSSAQNFGATPFEATLIHEYAHSLQKNISPDWGSDNDAATQAYKAIWDEDKQISAYANTEIREHFAENFARYVIKGEATEEFKEYLEKYAGIAPFNVDNYTHPSMIPAEDLEAQLSQILGSKSGSIGFNFNIHRPSRTAEDIKNEVASGRTPSKGNYRQVNISINAPGVIRPGEINTTFAVDEDGNLTVDAGLFQLPPELQGKDIATNVVKAMGGYVESIGGGKVQFTAGLDNGPYAWARMHANFETPRRDVPRYKGVLRRYLPLAEWWSENWQTFASLDDEQKIETSRLMVGEMNTNKVPSDVAAMMADYSQMTREAYSRGEIEYSDAQKFIAAALQNDWTLNPADIAYMRSLLLMSDSEITPNSFASVGENSRGGESKAEDTISLGFGPELWDAKQRGQTIPVSSLGRIIMMTGGSWRGTMVIRPPKEKTSD